MQEIGSGVGHGLGALGKRLKQLTEDFSLPIIEPSMTQMATVITGQWTFIPVVLVELILTIHVAM